MSNKESVNGPNKIFKAKVIEADQHDTFEAVIYDGCMWRIFGTPYKNAKCLISSYKTSKGAQRGAESTAAALGITLKWEDK